MVSHVYKICSIRQNYLKDNIRDEEDAQGNVEISPGEFQLFTEPIDVGVADIDTVQECQEIHDTGQARQYFCPTPKT